MSARRRDEHRHRRMNEWERIEWETEQRLVGALVGRYGAALSEETQEQARILAFVALAFIRPNYEEQRRALEAAQSELRWFAENAYSLRDRKRALALVTMNSPSRTAAGEGDARGPAETSRGAGGGPN